MPSLFCVSFSISFLLKLIVACILCVIYVREIMNPMYRLWLQERRNTLGHLDQYMAQHGRTVKQSHRETVYVMILFNFSSRVPIPHWLCIFHVHWCRDCETVPEQHWNNPRTVSQSQCTPPQFKQIIFGIKNESEVQGQSSSEFTGILTVLKCICGLNLEILTWIGDE